MKFLQLILFMIFSVLKFSNEVQATTVKINNYVDGYYWRDYTGYIPPDAVPAGRDVKGQTTYIGQGLHPGGHLTPGMISRNSDKVSYEFSRSEHLVSEDVKILCSQQPGRLIWFKVDIKHSIDNLNGNHLIIAGHDNAGPLAIGRKDRGTEVAVGKVLVVGTEFHSIFTTKDGKGLDDGAYEVLVFNTTTTTDADGCYAKNININFY